MRARTQPLSDVVYVAIREDRGGEWTDLSTIAFSADACRQNAKGSPASSFWKDANPLRRVVRVRLTEEPA